MEGLPRAKRGTRDYLNALTYSVQSPPIVVKDLVITPAAISSLIKTKEQIPGWIRAFDARTGKVRWTFQPIPQKGEFGSDTWQDGSNEYAGKVTVWTIMSADEELGLLYLPTNTTAPDFYGAHRLGNNLFAESVVALDINTGKRVWHFQTVHHGLWDYDNPAAPNLLDITVNGTRIKALAQITKQGFIYTFDRVDRKADVADRREAGACRPMCLARRRHRRSRFRRSRRRSSIRASRSTISPTSRPRSARWRRRRSRDSRAVRCSRRRRSRARWCGRARPAARTGAAPPSIRRRACCTCRRATRIAVSKLSPPGQALGSNLLYMQTPGRNPQMPDGLPLFKPPYSRMTAIDMNTGNHAWMIPTGAGDRIRNNPQLKGLNLPPVGGDITLAGPLLTKTLLIYALTTGGSNGGARLVAFDKATGKELASIDLPGAAIGTPMTYSIGGKQYIAITVNGRTSTDIPELIALALP